MSWPEAFGGVVHRFKVGDAVTLVNEYGAVFPGKTVVAVDQSKFPAGSEPRYFIEPTDTPWFSFSERDLKHA